MKSPQVILRKIYLIAAIALISSMAFEQTGTLQGVITDAITGAPIPFANVVLTKSGNQTAGTTTDFDTNKTCAKTGKICDSKCPKKANNTCCKGKKAKCKNYLK